MEKRELLEAAARAAGLFDNLIWWELAGCFQIKGEMPAKLWNPLEDDGDALRLAVKLGIGIEWWESMPNGICGRVNFDGNGVILMENVHDKAAILRRAIVRAAAAIDAQRRET